MNNIKKGFTLVELLGVIVVLAILALITIPIISNVINDVRIKSLRNSAYGLIEAGNLYYAQYGNNSNIRFDINDNKVESKDTDNLISYKGSIKTGTVILDRKGKVTVCITDGKNSAYKNYNETKVTAVKGKICSIKENSSIVYLDDEATIKEYDNVKLTELANDFSTRISELENEISSLKEDTINEIYPIGSIYISTTDDTVEKVQNRFGGTWQVYGNGRTLMSSTDTSEQTGGESSYTYTPAGTVGNTALEVSQMPAHTHTRGTMNITGGFQVNTSYYDYGGTTNPIARWANGSFSHSESGREHPNALNYSRAVATNIFNFDASKTWSGETSSVGGGGTHTHTFTGTSVNIPTVSPYITVYMYKRTA